MPRLFLDIYPKKPQVNESQILKHCHVICNNQAMRSTEVSVSRLDTENMV